MFLLSRIWPLGAPPSWPLSFSPPRVTLGALTYFLMDVSNFVTIVSAPVNVLGQTSIILGHFLNLLLFQDVL